MAAGKQRMAVLSQVQNCPEENEQYSLCQKKGNNSSHTLVIILQAIGLQFSEKVVQFIVVNSLKFVHPLICGQVSRPADLVLGIAGPH